jgi:hypothetical protein
MTPQYPYLVKVRGTYIPVSADSEEEAKKHIRDIIKDDWPVNIEAVIPPRLAACFLVADGTYKVPKREE